MSAQSAHLTQIPHDQTAEDAQFYRRVLHRLIEIGAEIAEDVLQQVNAPAPPSAEPGALKPDLTPRFERVSRAIHSAVQLARKIAEPAPAQPNRTAARKRIIREVEDAIQRRVWEKEIKPEEADILEGELAARLDSPDLEQEIMVRNVPDIIVDMLRDLGLSHIIDLNHPWKRRTPKHIEQLLARAAAPQRNLPASPWFDEKGPDRSLGPDPSTRLQQEQSSGGG